MSETNPYQELLEQLQACENQHERDWLSLRFSMAQLPEVLQAAVRASVVPRFFDHAFLNALLDQPLDEEQFTRFLEQSYIEPYPGEGRYNVHERNRKLLQERLWQEDEALYRELSRRAFAYCKAQDQEDITWRIETIYHQLIVEPDKGAYNLNNTCLKWMNPLQFVFFNKAESLLGAVQEHWGMKRLTEKAAHYFLLNQARVDVLYERCQRAKEVLQQIPFAILQDDPYLQREGFLVLGRVHFYLSEFLESLKMYEKARPLCKNVALRLDRARCLLGLGGIFLQFYDFKKARRCFDKALKLSKRNQLMQANSFFGIGNVLLQLSNFKKARLLLNKALKIFRKMNDRIGEANCICVLGKVHLAYSEFLEAQQHFSDSLKLYRKIENQRGEANALQSFGDLSVKIGDFIAAKQYYEQTSALAEHIHCPEGVTECLEGFAKLHQAQGQLQQAEEYWQKAAGKYHELTMPLRAEKCLEKLRQLREQDNDMTKQKNEGN